MFLDFFGLIALQIFIIFKEFELISTVTHLQYMLYVYNCPITVTETWNSVTAVNKMIISLLPAVRNNMTITISLFKVFHGFTEKLC